MVVDQMICEGEDRGVSFPTRYFQCQEAFNARMNESTLQAERSKRERHLTLALLITLSVIIALSFVVAFYSVRSSHHKEEISPIIYAENEMPRAESLVKRKQATLIHFRKIFENKICLTKGCVQAAAALIQRMNESVNPCDDMYEFSCGNFIKNAIIPDDDILATELTLIDDELMTKLRLVLEEPITGKDSHSTIIAKNLYASCMNTDRINEMGLEPLRQIINEYGGWPVIEGNSWNGNNFSWINAMYINRKLGLPFNAIFDLGIATNLLNSTQRIIWIDQPSFSISREFLALGLNDSAVQAYLKYSIDVALLLGADRSRAEEEMKQILEFQIKLAQLAASQEDRREINSILNIKTLKEMMQLVPEIPWVEYINRLLQNTIMVTENEKINLGDTNFITNFTKLLEQTPKRVIANFIVWRAITETDIYLSDDIRKVIFDYARSIGGQSSLPSRYEECIDVVSENLDFAVGNLYVKNYFDENSKSQINDLVTYLRRSFEWILKRVEWMDDSTRKEAIAKLKAMKSYIAYADELLNDRMLTDFYSKLQIGANDTLLNNILKIALFDSNYIASQLKEKVNQTSWKERPPVAISNAFYSFDQNSLEFPAGILQGHFFMSNRPKYMNYAAIGYVIGHEITHGFDDQGRNFDSKGNVRNWWQPETEKKFKEKAQCITNQYSSYSDPEIDLKLNGENTLGENIADNGGLKAAYQAYQNWVKKNGREDKLPGVDYTPNQLFWISSAQVWCGVFRPQYLRDEILTDDHSPARFRIIGTFSNSKEFAKDFNCRLGSRMNPRKKCEVW